MPIYKTITVSPTTKVYIWKVTEPEAELAKDVELTAHCQNRMDGMKSEAHRRAFLSIRHLLAEAGYVDSDLYYDDFGKPHLKDGKYISITHSHHFTGIIVSETDEVGIDIEMQRDKILKIAHKFTPIQEYKTLANSEALMRKLTIVWGAKESLYKIYAQQGLSFLRHINVIDFSFEDTRTVAEIMYKGKKSHYEIEFLEFEGFTCVYALKMMGG
ncbi:MAG: 4'-phosphopantetheinyl transferase superfamily protein [Allomuricauda sp.]|jgi:phosphopantetheinyl transferase|uniref:4'-phosphopantetheinyl transferase superfamily protein n=1 Tax=Flagellimonas sp. MMG031 TaxID=3158549 RepID=A0AAU7MYX7_9FLAO|nr:4'-phosphopantetheinyl transferase family protein [Allomuricauda sp.]MBO6531485.1 4'-phosphopantetheinyl transferase superfamily protein [Allomuricauda sp.]MBO6587740.1 4'-phosphopantetheinyl transferase superfamily protein [Allomuricauda sp.]MBO6617365.1 4'-phosphopantetheinyl transferase superfamily protein [Allomuricauda sp.]MBO6643624.1 4'-phosphopantetheinyl transferase superfamily protein [Allomuricauda sp.]MBO6745700.1 4'-phosphopantetheinyl transferase superfamily protein [Allomuric